jgi:hypothetical protein
MSEQSSQPDLQDRQLIPARSRVSLSREIGEAVITHNIFGNAKVRIIRKNDKLHRAMWLLALIGAGIVAAVVWQGWVSSQPTVADVPMVAPGAEVAEVAPASLPEAAPTLAAPALVDAQPVAQPSIAHASTVPVAVVSPRPLVAPRPVIVKPQSAPQETGGLLAPTQFATSLPAKPAPRPVVAPAPVPRLQTAASSPAIAVPLSSPLAKDSAAEVEPANPQGK